MTVIGDDAVSCYQYNMSVFWNFVDSIKYLIAFVGAPDNTSNVYLSIESLGLVIHKAPLVWDECIKIVFDIEYLDTLFKELGDVRNLELWTHLVENMMYNFADMLHNEEIGREALREWIFEESKGACERGAEHVLSEHLRSEHLRSEHLLSEHQYVGRGGTRDA